MIQLHRQLSTIQDNHNQSDDKTIFLDPKTKKEQKNSGMMVFYYLKMFQSKYYFIT